MRDSTPPGTVRDRDLGVGDLALAALAPQLAHRLDEQEHPVHAGVRVREPAAVRVHRQRAARAELAVLDERAALALGAEAEVLEVQQRGDGELS